MGKYDFGAEPLPKVSCTSSNCKEDLHCFRPKKPKTMKGSKCRDCEADLVDWDRVQKRDYNDVDSTIAFLKKENVRSHFWNIEINNSFKFSNVVQGKKKLTEKAAKRLQSSVGCAGDKLYYDGRQTPLEQWNIIYFAQHATATCCRKCIQYWHGIPYDRDLTEEEIEYFKKLIIRYIDEKIGEMPDSEKLQLKLNF